MSKPNIVVIIPALNEEASIGKVIQAIPKEWVNTIIVANNGSTDSTAIVAEQAGATVVNEPKRGYGAACLKALEFIKMNQLNPKIVVFLDGDFSDYPEELPLLVEPILNESADLVIGSRALGQREKNSMTIPQVFGNWLSTWLMAVLFGFRFTDLGPFRAIKYAELLKLNMADTNYGWTMEMQAKALKHQLKCTEVPVNYKVRIGTSKVSGTVKGVFLAGYKILYTLFKIW